MDIQQRIKQIADNAGFICPVCGNPLFITDYTDRKLTFHCSSDKAKFWAFERNSPALSDAKFHWDQSMKELFISRDS